ncbi:MAG: hypothetical protein ACREF4_20610, partial [Gammaproteobacteria bacterium]
VDYTRDLLVRGFRDEVEKDRSPGAAVEGCFRVVFTTLTIALSFGRVGASDLSLSRNLGLITASVTYQK